MYRAMRAISVFCLLIWGMSGVEASLLTETESNGTIASAQYISASAFTLNSSLRHEYHDGQSHIFDFSQMPTAQILGSFLGVSDKDYYAISGHAGDRIFVEVTGRTALTESYGNNDSALFLHNGSGNILYSITTDHEPVINDFMLPADGIYFLQLHTTTLDNRPLSDYLLEVSRIANVNSVPEPKMLLLFCLGLIALRFFTTFRMPKPV